MTVEADIPRRGLADTSVFIAHEGGRATDGIMPPVLGVSIVTIAELRAGVLAAGDRAVRALRLTTLQHAESLSPIPIDDAVATAWAELRLTLRDAGRRLGVNDSWIAATAIAHGLSVISQDADYDGVPGLSVIRI
ncbi:MAG: type II toxin-antitoxin system VapC family toxin [Candidatus Dormibacteria bacterium]